MATTLLLLLRFMDEVNAVLAGSSYYPLTNDEFAPPSDHPDQFFVQYILCGIANWFHIGFDCHCFLHQPSSLDYLTRWCS